MYQANGMEYAAMQRQGVATMGNERPMEYSRMLPRMRTNMNFGREKLPWSQELWKRIDETVHTECKRTGSSTANRGLRTIVQSGA